MLWVLKRIVSMRWFFLAPKTCWNWWAGLYLRVRTKKIIFLFINQTQPKHMLWVLKRIVSMRGFFLAPKTCSNWWVFKENIYNFTHKAVVYLNPWITRINLIWRPICSSTIYREITHGAQTSLPTLFTLFWNQCGSWSAGFIHTVLPYFSRNCTSKTWLEIRSWLYHL